MTLRSIRLDLRDLRGNQKIKHVYILKDLKGNQKIKHDTISLET